MAPDAVWGLQLVRCGHNDRGYYCTLFPVGVHHPLPPACLRTAYVRNASSVAADERSGDRVSWTFVLLRIIKERLVDSKAILYFSVLD